MLSYLIIDEEQYKKSVKPLVIKKAPITVPFDFLLTVVSIQPLLISQGYEADLHYIL